jgi:ubiquinone/menaquinone biosynthesis C-methylase UbiE
VPRPRNNAKITYNRYSFVYDLLSGDFERKYTNTGLNLLAIEQGERVLEIGSGTGHVLVSLAKSVGPKGSVAGIDISDRMCVLARRRIERAGLMDRVSIHCTDAMRLPFKASEFDAIFMSFTLELFDTPDIPRLLLECKRVLKPNGRISVVSLSKSKCESRIERLYTRVHQLFPSWLDCRPIHVAQALSKAGLNLLDTMVQPMFGLHVSMILAIKPER